MNQIPFRLLALLVLIATFAPLAPAHAAEFVVTNTGLTGPGSFANAVDAVSAECAEGPHVIRFDIEEGDSGYVTDGEDAWWQITYPALTSFILDCPGTIVDGFSQTELHGDRNTFLYGGASVGADQVLVPPVAGTEIVLRRVRLALAAQSVSVRGLTMNSASMNAPDTVLQDSVLGALPNSWTPLPGDELPNNTIGLSSGAKSARIEHNAVTNDSQALNLINLSGTQAALILRNFARCSMPDPYDLIWTYNSTVTIQENELLMNEGEIAVECAASHCDVINNDILGKKYGIRFALETSSGTAYRNTFTNGSNTAILCGATTFCTMSENLFVGNGGIAIDITKQNSTGGNGISVNSSTVPGDCGYEPGTANSGIDAPVITNVSLDAGIASVSGFACFGGSVEIYRALAGAGDCIGAVCYGEGAAYVGTTIANSSGAFSWTGPGLGLGQSVSATVTDGDGQTSEFGANYELPACFGSDDCTVAGPCIDTSCVAGVCQYESDPAGAACPGGTCDGAPVAPVCVPDDTDGDGVCDGAADVTGVCLGGPDIDPFDPNSDTDGDGISDIDETEGGVTSPVNPDTDGDGTCDGIVDVSPVCTGGCFDDNGGTNPGDVDTGCNDLNPFCVTLGGAPVCVSCIDDAQCSAESYCDGNNVCVLGCNEDSDCSGTECTPGSCVANSCAEAPLADGTPCSLATCLAGVCIADEPPTVVDDNYKTPEDTPITFNITLSDSDPNLGTLSLGALVTPPADGAIVPVGAQELTYTPALDFNGVDAFVIEVCDAGGQCAPNTVSIDVLPVNDVPVALADTAFTLVDVPVSIDVVDNDVDPDVGDVVTLTDFITEPTNGSVAIALDGTALYSPGSGFVGEDSFEYAVCDQLDACDFAVVTVTVTEEPPTCDDVDGDGVAVVGGDDTLCTVQGVFDTNDADPTVCADTDGDECDDCSSGTFAPDNDGPDLDGDGICDASDTCVDLDGDGLGDGTNGNEGCADPTTDSDDTDESKCADTDTDGCDDCSFGTFDPAADGPDTNGDGQCDSPPVCVDVDGDGLGDGTDGNTACIDPTTDSDDADPNVCADTDADGCDDCSSGTFDPADDGVDTNGDGQCDGTAVCVDVDGDGLGDGTDGNTACIDPTTDSDDADPNVCADTDADGCDDCSSGTFDPADDGVDTNGDGQCDGTAVCVDVDGDGLGDGTDGNTACIDPTTDSDDADPNVCADTDADGCDDCVSGTFAPGLVACTNDDNDDDGVLNDDDNCPDDKNTDQADQDNDGLGDVCDDDRDGDGVLNSVEETDGTLADDPDSDDDGLNDGEEKTYQTDPLDSDSDDDGLTDGIEVNTWLTDPNNPDSDGGGVNDGKEVQNETSPADGGDDWSKSKVRGGGLDTACAAGGDAPAPLPLSLALMLGVFLAMIGVRRSTGAEVPVKAPTRALLTGVALVSVMSLATVLAPSAAHAGGATGFTTIHYEPTPGRDRVLSLPGTLVGPHLSVYGGVWFSYADGLLLLDTDAPAGRETTPLLSTQAMAHVAVAASFFDRVALELSIPVMLDGTGDESTFGGLGGAAAGDLVIRVRGLLVGGPFESWGLGASGAIYAPTGDATALTGDGGVRGSLRLTGTYRDGPLLASLSLGALFRAETGEFRGLPMDHELLFGIGAKVKPIDPLYIGLEIQGRTPLSAPFGETGTSPVEVRFGPEVVIAKQFSIEAGVGAGLLSGYGSPNWRIFLGVQWMPPAFAVGDIDGDGIADDVDRCVSEPEDFDRFADDDGCPEYDNDDDEIPDTKDRCPTVAAGSNGSAGCPRDRDTDKDGLADAVDRCPTDAQTSSGRHGCPPGLDSDSDGILDMDDRCPMAAAVNGDTKFGCPEGLDSDGDGLLDAFDKCAYDSGGPNAIATAGCPPDLDSDGDGLLDSIDKCPAHAGDGSGGAMGCPANLDSDGDGLLDAFDKCPDHAGDAGHIGCPEGLDSDGDGLLDEFDRCPRHAQDAAGAAGCPANLDSDGDGLLDQFDKCPAHASTDTVLGCPLGLDSDGDGLLDVDDQCPSHKPDAAGKNGCPSTLDSDGDGILDMDDRCPLVKVGEGGANGCPSGYDSDRDKVPDMSDDCLTELEDGEAPKPSDGCGKSASLKIVDCRLNIADNVFFASGKAKLKTSATKILKSVALAVRRLQSADAVIVEGHTDSSGGTKFNLGLSIRRAQAVADDLKPLLTGLKVTFRGFGETKPVASNKSFKGRAQNRRVEFRIEGGKCKREAVQP